MGISSGFGGAQTLHDALSRGPAVHKGGNDAAQQSEDGHQKQDGGDAAVRLRKAGFGEGTPQQDSDGAE